MGKLSDRVCEMLAKQISQRGIVVWYDPEKAYSNLAHNLNLPETSVLHYEDSFFRLRHDLEPYLDFITAEGKPKDGSGVPPSIVIYVPADRNQTSHALVEAET